MLQSINADLMPSFKTFYETFGYTLVKLLYGPFVDFIDSRLFLST